MRTGDMELIHHYRHDFSEHLLSLAREFDKHMTCFFWRASTRYQPAALGSDYKFDGAVVANLQLLGNSAYGWTGVSRKPFYCQQQLVLAWFNSGCARCAVTQ